MAFDQLMHGERNFPFRKQHSSLDIGLPDGTGDEVYLEVLARRTPGFTGADQQRLVAGVVRIEREAADRVVGLRQRDVLPLDFAPVHRLVGPPQSATCGPEPEPAHARRAGPADRERGRASGQVLPCRSAGSRRVGRVQHRRRSDRSPRSPAPVSPVARANVLEGLEGLGARDRAHVGVARRSRIGVFVFKLVQEPIRFVLAGDGGRGERRSGVSGR